MKKAWFALLFASVIFISLNQLFPKETVDNYLFPKSKTQFQELLNEQLNDTIEQNRIADSIALIEKRRVKSLAKKQKRKHDSIRRRINYKQVNRDGLKDFFKKLNVLEKDKNKQVRIAFFGDSMEDGDMIVMQFRNFLQKKFGGKGVGYVPINSVTASGRYSIKHRFTRNWKTVNFMKKGYGAFPFGLNGKTFYVGKDTIETQASVTYKKGSAYKNLPLINPILFYGKSINDSIYKNPTANYTLNDDAVEHMIPLKPKYLLNTYTLPSYKKKIKITVTDQKTIPFYGVSFASKNGVIVDNLSVRGNSGLPLIKLNSSLMQQFDKRLKYDLVILAYGTNVFSFKNEKYLWYKSKMLRNIKHLQKCFPNTDFLIMSMGDRSTKIDGTMQTPEHLPKFINLQYRMAKESKAGFYNLYTQMGGKNSMVRWVEEYKLANKDYTHFSPKGANKMGHMLYKWMIKNYKEHNKNK